MNTKFGKESTVLKVFHSISDGKKTRSLIADNTGLSVMTVGTIVDMLIDMNVLSQHSMRTGHVGTKTRYIEPRKYYRTAVFSISENEFKLYLVDISKNTEIAAVKKASDAFSYENDLIEFIMDSRATISGSKLIGVGVLLCGDLILSDDGYIVSRTNPMLKFNINSVFKNYYEEFDVTFSDEKSSLLGYISDIEAASSNILALFIDDKVRCASFRGGDEKIILNDCGKLIYYKGRSINDVLSDNPDIESQVEAISELIIHGILLSSPDKVYLDGKKYTDILYFCKMAAQKTEFKCISEGINLPEFVFPDRKISALNGIAARIADKWLIDLLSQKK